jgi:hypothetical protein
MHYARFNQCISRAQTRVPVVPPMVQHTCAGRYVAPTLNRAGYIVTSSSLVMPGTREQPFSDLIWRQFLTELFLHL